MNRKINLHSLYWISGTVPAGMAAGPAHMSIYEETSHVEIKLLYTSTGWALYQWPLSVLFTSKP